jgi:general secretion pathway protein M
MEFNIRFGGRKLNRREQFAVIAAGGIILFYLFIQFAVSPVFDKKTRMSRDLAAKKMTLAEMESLKSEYDAIKNQKDKNAMYLAGRKKGFTLFSFLDKLAGEVGIKGNINYMKPSTSLQTGSRLKKSVVEMKLQGITMKQLTTYLHGVETSGNIVAVKRLSISIKGSKDRFVSAVMQVETVEL